MRPFVSGKWKDTDREFSLSARPQFLRDALRACRAAALFHESCPRVLFLRRDSPGLWRAVSVSALARFSGRCAGRHAVRGAIGSVSGLPGHGSTVADRHDSRRPRRSPGCAPGMAESLEQFCLVGAIGFDGGKGLWDACRACLSRSLNRWAKQRNCGHAACARGLTRLRDVRPLQPTVGERTPFSRLVAL